MEGYAVGVITLLAINCIAAMGVSLFTGFTAFSRSDTPATWR